MITDDQLEATQERIRLFHAQVVDLRKVETHPLAYRLSASGFLAEIDRMQLEVRDYLALHPSELVSVGRQYYSARSCRSGFLA